MTEDEVLAKRAPAPPPLATVAEARAIMLSGIAAVGEEQVALTAASNFVLSRLSVGTPAQSAGVLVDVLPLGQV